MQQAGGFFLSRLRLDTSLWDAAGRKPLDLLNQCLTGKDVGPRGGPGVWIALAGGDDLQGVAASFPVDRGAVRRGAGAGGDDLCAVDFCDGIGALLWTRVVGAVAALVGDYVLVRCLQAWGKDLHRSWILQLSYHPGYERRTRTAFPEKLIKLS